MKCVLCSDVMGNADDAPVAITLRMAFLIPKEVWPERKQGMTVRVPLCVECAELVDVNRGVA